MPGGSQINLILGKHIPVFAKSKSFQPLPNFIRQSISPSAES